MIKQTSRYSLKNNISFLWLDLWKKDRPFFFWGILKGVTFVAVPFLGILLQKSFLEGILHHWAFEELLGTVLVLTAVSAAASILNHCATVGVAHYQGLNRMRFLVEIEKVFLRCPYQTAENPGTQVELDKVSDLVGTSAPRTGINGMHNGMYEVFVSILGLIVFGSMVGRIRILLILLVAAGAVGIGMVEKWADSQEFALRMQQAPMQKKQEYFRNKLSKSGPGKDIRSYHCQGWLLKKLQQVVQEKEKLQEQQVEKLFFKDVALTGIEILQNGGAICWIALLCLKGSIPISDFFVYLTAVLQLSEYVGKFMKALDLVKYANKDIGEIRSFLDMEQEDIPMEGEKEGMEAFEIRFEHVYFRYPNASDWLYEDLTFTIQKGEKIALVGSNGAGKTTIVKLMCGFYPVTKGRILFDGEDIAQMEKGTLYRRISAVFQDLVVLPFSVGQNVALCQEEEMDTQRVRECLNLAGISEKLPDLSGMLDKRVHPSGIELSGGEKQKLVFARALYKRSGCLILDEPTSALDPLGESRLYQKYHEISENKTTLFISHRLASTSFCDRILLLDQGRIAEEGTHEELLKKGGKYANMFYLQSQYYQKEEKEDKDSRVQLSIAVEGEGGAY